MQATLLLLSLTAAAVQAEGLALGPAFLPHLAPWRALWLGDWLGSALPLVLLLVAFTKEGLAAELTLLLLGAN